MANELTTQDHPNAPLSQRPASSEPLFKPREIGAGGHIGSIEIESARAIAEAQAAMVVAKRFPRDETAAFVKMKNACSRIGFATSAFYEYKRGGQKIRGPSIRMAEELARNWGNIVYGIRELSQAPGVSEMQAFAYDLETNVKSEQNFTVRHIRDKSEGADVALTSQRDIYEITANMGARRLRARILALLPDDYVEDAIAAAEDTIRSGGKNAPPLPDRIKRMVAAFEPMGVTAKMIETRLGHPLDQTTPDELVSLQGSHKAIKDGMSTVADEFAARVNEDGQKVVAPPRETKKPAADKKPAENAPAQDTAPKTEAKPQSAPPAPQEAQQQASPPKQEAQQPETNTAASGDPEGSGDEAEDEDVF